MLTPIAEAVAALKAFVETLAQRPDVELLTRRFGRRAAVAEIQYHRERPHLLPAELVDFYELLNGIHVEWRFVGGDGSGCINIEQLDVYRFQTDEESYNCFGEGKVSLRFDTLQPEYGTFWVADSPREQAQARLMFAALNGPGYQVADSLADYLHQAIAAGFVNGWPFHSAGTEASVRRINEAPVVPGKIKPGGRVEHIQHLRGEVLQNFTAPKGSPAHLYGKSPHLALLRLDVGPTVWASHTYLKALPPRPDLYEQYRADPEQLVRLGEAEGWDKALRVMGLLWGSFASYSGYGDYPHMSSAPIAAALLNSLPLTRAAELVQRVVTGVEAGRDASGQWPAAWNPNFQFSPAEQQQALEPDNWHRQRWQGWVDTILETLISGLAVRILVEPAASRTALPVAAVNALQQSTRLPVRNDFNFFALMRKLLGGLHKDLYLDTIPPVFGLPAAFPILRT